MSTSSVFDHQPDPKLGRELRAVLSAHDDAQFVHGVVAAADRTYGERQLPGEWWEVLTVWARPGLAAALVLLAVVGFWLGMLAGSGNGSATLGDPLRTVDAGLEVPVLLAERSAPDLDVVLAVALEN